MTTSHNWPAFFVVHVSFVSRSDQLGLESGLVQASLEPALPAPLLLLAALERVAVAGELLVGNHGAPDAGVFTKLIGSISYLKKTLQLWQALPP